MRGIVSGHAQHHGQQTLQEPPSRQAQGVVQHYYNLYSAPHFKAGRLSVASLGDGDDSADEDGAAARDEGEEGQIRGELPSL